MVLARIPRSLTTASKLQITKWHGDPIVLAEPVQQWLDYHGFEYSLYRIATCVEFKQIQEYARGGHRMANTTVHARRFYIEFQGSHQLMLFKLAHDGVVHATEKDLGYI